MKRIRMRHIVLLLVLVLACILLSVLFTILARNGMILGGEYPTVILFGVAARDLVLIVAALILVFILVRASALASTKPIVEVTKAMDSVAHGDFGVQLELHDKVTEFRELQHNFNIMTEELRSNEYLRKDFIANVSHELKTPLSVISGYAHLIEEGGLSDDEQREYSAFIAHEADRLTQLVSNMLRLSRLDNQQIQPMFTLFALDEQIKRSAALFSSRICEKNITLSLSLAEADFFGDEELLGQIWQNLIDNAVKFTDNYGRISITLVQRAKELLVTVADNGAGMDSETARRAFEQFYRGDTGRKDGSGLGLPLVRRIAELHGGSVDFKSSKGSGSTFTVALPIKKSE